MSQSDINALVTMPDGLTWLELKSNAHPGATLPINGPDTGPRLFVRGKDGDVRFRDP